jgi:hypothetical protein
MLCERSEVFKHPFYASSGFNPSSNYHCFTLIMTMIGVTFANIFNITPQDAPLQVNKT